MLGCLIGFNGLVPCNWQKDRDRLVQVLGLSANFTFNYFNLDDMQQTDGLVQACYPGTLWETLRAQSNVTVWSDSIMFTGLNQMLDVPTPGQVLFAVRDSGLYQCVFGADVACMTQKKNWYASLTSPIGVGLLMLHWLPNATQSLIGPKNQTETSFQTYMTIAMNNTLNGTLDGLAWNIVVNHLNVSGYPASISLPPNQTANSSLGGAAQATILSVVPTCSGNGTLYILDRPLVPAGLPETSVNALTPLKDFCWTNILTLANDPANGVDYLATMLTIYSPVLLNSFLDPRSNATWLIANSAASEAIGNQFADYATKNPSDFQMIATSQVLLHMLPGGYCPGYLAGRSFRPFVGIIWNKDYLLNFSYIGPNELKIHNVNTNQNSTVTGKFLGTACYSTVYELSDNLHQWSMSNLSAVPRTTDSYLTAMPTVGSQALLYGVEETCSGRNIIERVSFHCFFFN